jgi:hypothetical protein
MTEMTETKVVVDSSKLYQLLRFYCLKKLKKTGRSPLKEVVKKAEELGWELWTTEVNLRRAKEALFRELSLKLQSSSLEEALAIAEWKVRLLLKVAEEAQYAEYLEQAVVLLEDWEDEPEDAHALALAISFTQKGYRVILWQNDEDFQQKEKEIAELGIELRSKLLDLTDL